MSKHIAIWIAWPLCGLTWGLCILTLWLMAVNASFDQEIWGIVAVASFGLVGALIVTHRVHNTVGWLYCGIASFGTLFSCAEQYTLYTGVNHPGALPGAWLMAWFASDWTGTIAWLLLVLWLPLLFPDGQLPSRHWRPYACFVAGLMIVQVIVSAFTPHQIDERYPQLVNPLGVNGAQWLLLPLFKWASILSSLCILVSAAALLLRYRGADHEARQKIKWFTYAAMLLPLAALATVGLNLVPISAYLGNVISDLFWATAFFAIPIGTGVAILRHRLYDIDRLISRTLSYSLLTLLLALIYFGCVLLFQQLARTVSGSSESPLVTVFSTLAIAALFTPLRRRVQDLIDRRFYRRRYNAELVLATFGETVRNETDLEQLSERLVSVVKETMQPTQINLWLRKTERAY
jgi:hypothetical protein